MASTPQHLPPKTLNTKDYYLIAYNLLSACLWSAVLASTIRTLAFEDHEHVFQRVGEVTKWTQTLAALEIVHVLTGVVRAPLMTTAMQVASRFALVWGVVHFYPQVATQWPYSTMLLAWSFTEVVRYMYFTLEQMGPNLYPLLWLRYSGFLVLYPVGIASELAELVLAFMEAAKSHDYIPGVIIVVVVLAYVPGSPKLYGHMRTQRRKRLARARTD